MPRILILKRGEISYNSLNVFADHLGDALKKQGVDIDYYSIAEEFDVLIELVQKNKYDAAIAFNSLGQHDYKAGNGNLWDYLGTPFFNYIVDHPQMHNRFLNTECRNYYVLCMDRDHIGYIEDYYPRVKKSFFLPLGGLTCSEQSEPSSANYSAREHDVLFMASSGNLSALEKNIIDMPEGVRKVTADSIDYLLDNRDESLEAGLRRALFDNNIDATQKEIYIGFATVCLPIVNNYLRAYIREEAVRYLASSGAKISLYGTGWDSIAEEYKNINRYNNVSYDQTASIFRKSKIIFNVMPFFKNGSHDRIATGMLNKAAVFTDKNKYLSEEFNESESDRKIAFWDVNIPEDIPQKVTEMLENTDMLATMSETAYKYACQNMTWDCVARKLMEILKQI